MDYELIGGFVLVAVSLIFCLLAYATKSKELRLLFLMVLMISLVLDVAFVNEVVKLHNTDGSINGLAGLMTAGLSMVLFMAVGVDSVIVIMLIPFALEKIHNLYKKPAQREEEQLMRELDG